MSATDIQKKPRGGTTVAALDIEFWDLSFLAPGAKGRKHILKSISGHFRAGELSAILGPSGAGKSTLMNILMGTLHTNVTGSVLVNGQPRDVNKFNRQTTYIMQEDLLQDHLTVQESMMVAANLKMSHKCKREEKLERVNEVLEMLDLSACKDTRSEMLSGGQRRRLSVALELVSNPPVIFLDEPTTGLDSVATKQMMRVLSLLAEQGRTVVCSVHQPSATIFNQFDQVYILARGQCVYQGEPRDLVPFLEDSGLICPTTHNPADFSKSALSFIS
ncbi:ATP-binding cassette sub-family G member 1-like [Anabrus simplex]|uniref:ATP-binding cassette sub-family G member 1-like n=1 Tax=Anabrus simplex TaxID=316456 RepID=UPI0035A3B322